MNRLPSEPPAPRPLTWRGCYREVELYKAAVRLYTKPLFDSRKAYLQSTDGRTLFDFARHGIRLLGTLHRQLLDQSFCFRPAKALTRVFDGKRRTLYVWPWEERLVSLLLYRVVTARLHGWFAPCSYAYRRGPYGLDRCQRHIARAARPGASDRYILKRDIRDFFGSIDHDVLLAKLRRLVARDDYLLELLTSAVRYEYVDDTRQLHQAARGVPFGTAVACLFANIYLTHLDYRLASLQGVRVFRYADDLLVIADSANALERARRAFDEELNALRLQSKPSQSCEFRLVVNRSASSDSELPAQTRFRHLGLEFRADGSVGLSRDKGRKIRNLFRFALRRYRHSLSRLTDPQARARLAVRVIRRTIDEGVRNVAIIDYYLKHITDERQLIELDRWLAEEVLSVTFGKGHRRGHFRLISFRELRKIGLPSLRHRHRLVRAGRLPSPFFIWKIRRAAPRGHGGSVARSARRPSLDARKQ